MFTICPLTEFCCGFVPHYIIRLVPGHECSIVPLNSGKNLAAGLFPCEYSSFSGEVYLLASSKSMSQSHSGKLYKLVDPKRYNPSLLSVFWVFFLGFGRVLF